MNTSTKTGLLSVLLSVLVINAGVSVIRVFFPAFIWYMSENLPLLGLLGVAVGVLAAGAILAALARRIQERRWPLLISVVVLAVARVVLQFSPTALIDSLAAIVGLVAWFTAVGLLWGPTGSARVNLPISVSAALCLDLLARMVLGGNAIVFQHTWFWQGLTVLAMFLMVIAAWKPMGGRRQSGSLFVLGPWLLAYFMLIGNPASFWLDGAPMHMAFALAGVICTVSLLVSWLGPTDRRFPSFAAALLVLIAAAAWWLQVTPSFLPAILAAIALPLLAGRGRLRVWGLLTGFLVLLFASLASLYDVTLGTSIALASSAVAALFTTSTERQSAKWPVALAASTALLCCLGLVLWTEPTAAYASRAATDGTEQTEADQGHLDSPDAVTVMTFNTHQGLDAELHSSHTAVAETIAIASPDIVALQEANIGRATNGFVDIVGLIQRTGGYEYVYYGANSADGVYGNAVLSRIPLHSVKVHHYEDRSSETRSYIEATVELSGGNLRFVTTHLDHLTGPSSVRDSQVSELVDSIEGETPTLLVGDFNGTTDSPEIQTILSAGWTDVWAEAGLGNKVTYLGNGADSPPVRIDFMFTSPGVHVDDPMLLQSRASDHLPLLAKVSVDSGR